MPTNPAESSQPLPQRPNLRHLKDQAKDLLKSGAAATLTEAQFQVARRYGFASWPKLKTHVESLQQIGQLKQAIDINDFERVKELLTANPDLHHAPLGYRGDGPLTWVAECRLPWEPPGRTRLAMAKWLIEHGSDVHQGGDAPLARAALQDQRIPMMELLVAHGADVNALWHGYAPIITFPCETLQPGSIKWLLKHGANPNYHDPDLRAAGSALDYVIGTYLRAPELSACIDLLLDHGGRSRYRTPAVLDLLRGRTELLTKHLEAEPDLIHRRFPDLDFGATGTRRLTLKGATLLHVAAEYGNVEAAQILLDRGADVNARAAVEQDGVGGQTPLFHAVTQFHGWGVPVARLLLARGADLSVLVKLPGHYERPDEVVACTPLGYALRFPEGVAASGAVALLREHGATE